MKSFLGFGPFEATPDHSSLSYIRQRLPLNVHEQVFRHVLEMAERRKLLSNKTAAVDSTLLEANAAMKSIVRKESGEDWNAYLTRLMRETGVIGENEEPTDEEKVSKTEWVSSTDPNARTADKGYHKNETIARLCGV